jgi:5-methylcytosine-specific restriction enzyme subunit McrC
VTIPVGNVYFLLLYAWRHIGEGEEALVSTEGITRLQDLFAHVLAATVTRLVARGLDRGYLAVEEPVRGVRGKLDLSVTLKRNHLANAQTHCQFDELQYDVLHNRIIKATLRKLLEIELDESIRARVRRLYRKLDLVSDVTISARDFRQLQLHRNNRVYDFALRLCRLIHDNVMIAPGGGTAQFRDFRNDEDQMARLFEEFVFSFFEIEQRRFQVSRPHIGWHDAQGSEFDLSRLPVMRTDVVLEAPDRCIILDTKFYAEALSGRFDTKKVRSGHLYQIFAYVENRSANRGKAPPHEGMLLYPVVSDRFAFEYRLKGHRIAVRSIDLDQPWADVHRDMLQLLS